MKKVFQLFWPIGLVLFAISIICGRFNLLSDFFKGFLDGMAVVFIIIGMVAWRWKGKKET